MHYENFSKDRSIRLLNFKNNNTMENYLKEFECENFEVFELARTSPTFRYILKPKGKTDKELPFQEYIDKYLVEFTFQDQIKGVKLRDLIENKKALLNQE